MFITSGLERNLRHKPSVFKYPVVCRVLSTCLAVLTIFVVEFWLLNFNVTGVSLILTKKIPKNYLTDKFRLNWLFHCFIVSLFHCSLFHCFISYCFSDYLCLWCLLLFVCCISHVVILYCLTTIYRIHQQQSNPWWNLYLFLSKLLLLVIEREG